MDMNLLSHIPAYVYSLLAFGFALNIWAYNYLIDDEQRSSIQLQNINIGYLRQVISMIPIIFLYLNFLQSSKIALIIFVILSSTSFLFYVFYFFQDIKKYSDLKMPKNALVVYIVGTVFALSAYLSSIYFVYVYLLSGPSNPLGGFSPVPLILIPVMLLSTAYLQKKKQLLNLEDRRKLVEANKGELRTVRIKYGIGVFATLLFGGPLLLSFMTNASNIWARVLPPTVFFLLVIALSIILYKNEQEILAYYGLPSEYIQAQRNYFVAQLVGMSLMVAILSLMNYFFF